MKLEIPLIILLTYSDENTSISWSRNFRLDVIPSAFLASQCGIMIIYNVANKAELSGRSWNQQKMFSIKAESNKNNTVDNINRAFFKNT